MSKHGLDSTASAHSPRPSWSPPQGDWERVLPPTGWLDNHIGPFKYRYWDGRDWTGYVSDGGTVKTALVESIHLSVG